MLLEAFQKCLNIRDKYLGKSRQMLGDNPADHDGQPLGFDEKYADPSGVRPDADLRNLSKKGTSKFPKWEIYPKPPPPHWHWKKDQAISADGHHSHGDQFEFEKCVIPGPMEDWSFKLDSKGVFQVYEPQKGTLQVDMMFSRC